MDLNERISRFEALVREEPDNDMAHFSLAGAYAQAGRADEAAAMYLRCTEINADMSKAYQLAGQALIDAGHEDRAQEVLTRGYTVATGKGDLMPAKAMGELLTSLGAPVPQVAGAKADGPADLVCSATGKPGSRLARPPFRGKLGEWMVEHITRQTWDEWLGMGTKIINELRLDLSRDEHDAVYDYAMRKYLRLDDTLYAELTGREPPRPGPEYKGTIDMILERMGQLESYQGELHREL